MRVVHDFLRDLYATVKKANPRIPLTVSDATLYWQPQPDLTHYDDILDFYDAHVYDDRPNLRDLRHALDKPYIIGEAGASVVGEHFTDQVIEARAVRSLLEQGRADGALAVLVHSIASQNVFPATRDRLTPTGEVLAQFQGAGAALREPSVWPIAGNERALVPFVTTTGAISPIGGAPWQAIKHLGRETAWESPAQHGWAGGP